MGCVRRGARGVVGQALLFVSLFSVFVLMSYRSSPGGRTNGRGRMRLMTRGRLTFPLSRRACCLDGSVFRFRRGKGRCLRFRGARGSLCSVIVFSVRGRRVTGQVPLRGANPGKLPTMFNDEPSPSSRCVLITRGGVDQLDSVGSRKRVVQGCGFRAPRNEFAPLSFNDCCGTPTFVGSSYVFLHRRVLGPSVGGRS